MSDKYEVCFLCGRETEKAGAGDGSLYSDDGEHGPFCGGCWRAFELGAADGLAAGRAEGNEELEECMAFLEDREGDRLLDRIAALLSEKVALHADNQRLREALEGIRTIAHKLDLTRIWKRADRALHPSPQGGEPTFKPIPGHTDHCAARQQWGDGECECGGGAPTQEDPQ